MATSHPWYKLPHISQFTLNPCRSVFEDVECPYSLHCKLHSILLNSHPNRTSCSKEYKPCENYHKEKLTNMPCPCPAEGHGSLLSWMMKHQTQTINEIFKDSWNLDKSKKMWKHSWLADNVQTIILHLRTHKCQLHQIASLQILQQMPPIQLVTSFTNLTPISSQQTTIHDLHTHVPIASPLHFYRIPNNTSLMYTLSPLTTHTTSHTFQNFTSNTPPSDA